MSIMKIPYLFIYVLPVCPSVRQLQSEMEEMNKLLKAVRRPSAAGSETQRWLNNMADQFEWISQAVQETSPAWLWCVCVSAFK